MESWRRCMFPRISGYIEIHWNMFCFKSVTWNEKEIAPLFKWSLRLPYTFSSVGGKNSTLSDIIKIWYVGNDVPNWFPTLKNFYRSPFSKWPPQYRTNSTLSDFNVIWYVGRLWCPELIPDIEKFLPVAIFKMAATIPHKFNIVRFQRPELILDIDKYLTVSIFKKHITEFFFCFG